MKWKYPESVSECEWLVNELGQELNLTQHLTCDLNIENYGENIEGNLFESLVGAIFLDIVFINL